MIDRDSGTFSTRRPRGAPIPRAISTRRPRGAPIPRAISTQRPRGAPYPRAISTRRPRGAPFPRAMRGNLGLRHALRGPPLRGPHAAIPKGTHAARPINSPRACIVPHTRKGSRNSRVYCPAHVTLVPRVYCPAYPKGIP